MTAVVAIGGGHGLAASIRAVRTYADDATAVVSTADDGGSSGRLRTQLGIPAVGDLRRCLVAMAGPSADGSRRLSEHRFDRGDLEGHPVGNVLLAAAHAQTGSLVDACDTLAGYLDIDPSRARVIPATEGVVTLVAGTETGDEVRGQVAIQDTPGVKTLRVEPADAPLARGVADAIRRADQIVIGPGSLYTSVLAAVVTPGLAGEVSRAPAQKVLVANLRADETEAKGHDVAAHVAALVAHGVEPDIVLHAPGGLPVGAVDGFPAVRFVGAETARMNGLAHDPEMLGGALAELC